MSVSRLSTQRNGIAVSLDGIRFWWRDTDAARTLSAVEVAWAEVVDVAMRTTRRGKTVISVTVLDVPAPYSVKLSRHDAEAAKKLFTSIAAEVAGRRRWREAAADDLAAAIEAAGNVVVLADWQRKDDAPPPVPTLSHSKSAR